MSTTSDMRTPRTTASLTWRAALAAVTMAAGLVLLVPSGCSTIPTAACGDEPDLDVCGRFQFECGTAVVCYSCGAAKRVDCGSCADTQTCGGGGVPHVCWPPLVDGGDDAAAEAGDDASATADGAIDGASSDGAANDSAASDSGMTDANIDAEPADGEASDATVDATDEAGPTVFLCPEDAVPSDDAVSTDDANVAD